MTAQPAPKPIQVTARDRELLEALGRLRFLSIPQLTALFFPSTATAERRLRRLYQHQLVVRVFLPVRPHDRRAHTIYALSAKGSRLLADHRGGDRLPHLSPREQRSGTHLGHTLRRNDLRIVLELLSREQFSLELLSWSHAKAQVRARTVLRSPTGKMERVAIVPDGCFTLSAHGRRFSFAVEIDMNTVSKALMAKRYRAYHRWWRRGNAHARFGPLPFRVLTLTTIPDRLDLLRALAQDAPEDTDQGTGLFWFALLEDAADIHRPHRLLEAIWTTAQAREHPPQPLLTD